MLSLWKVQVIFLKQQFHLHHWDHFKNYRIFVAEVGRTWATPNQACKNKDYSSNNCLSHEWRQSISSRNSKVDPANRRFWKKRRTLLQWPRNTLSTTLDNQTLSATLDDHDDIGPAWALMQVSRRATHTTSPQRVLHSSERLNADKHPQSDIGENNEL